MKEKLDRDNFMGYVIEWGFIFFMDAFSILCGVVKVQVTVEFLKSTGVRMRSRAWVFRERKVILKFPAKVCGSRKLEFQLIINNSIFKDQ